MATARTLNVGSPTTKRLGFLPVIGAALGRLRLAERIDEVVPPDPRNVVTAGQCVEALVVAILTGTHTLYRVDQLLAGYDLELGLGWEARAGDFHDERLARALDALRLAGLNKVVSAVIVQVFRDYALDLSILRLDTTTCSVHGAYAESVPPLIPESPDAIPHVTKGRSKDRKGLKQIVFGTAVTSEGVPIYGRAASGNRNDSPELRHVMRRVGERVPDPNGTTLVGDSKLFAGETLLLALRLGFHFVTLVPKTTNAREKALKGFRAARRRGELEVLLEKEGRSGEVETWRGCSVPVVFTFKDRETGDETRCLFRCLVVESSALKRLKRASLEKKRDRERKTLEKEARAELKKVYRCAADAAEAGARLRAKAAAFHKLAIKTSDEDVPLRRSRPGRPRRSERRATEHVWRAWFVPERDDEAFEDLLSDESSFVLVTSHPLVGEAARTNREIFETYHDQGEVERVMHWFKGELDFAPIFLKKPSRIAALAQVYVIALMVYGLVQRDARRKLEEGERTIPGNLKPTNKPTTEVVFRLFEGVAAARRAGSPGVVVENLTTAQVEGYRALGVGVLDRPGVSTATPRAPGPGDRGYYRPRPRRRRRQRRLLAGDVRASR